MLCKQLLRSHTYRDLRAPALPQRVFAWAVEHELKQGDAVHLLHVIVGPSGEDLRVSGWCGWCAAAALA